MTRKFGYSLDGFVESIVFSDEATFHLSGKVNRYNVRISGAANPHVESIVFIDESTFHLSGKVNRYNVRIWGAANPYVIAGHVCFIPLLNCIVCMCIL